MIRLALCVLCALAATSSAYADCGGWNADILRLTNWTATLINKDSYALTIEFQHDGEKAFRMIEGGVYFEDRLQRSIDALSLSPDLTLAPGETGTEQWDHRYSTGGPRLATVSHDDVTAYICVEAIVYEDGTTEQFE